jgi:hypothetical protein
VSIRSLSARLERLQARAGEHYVIGQDRYRDRRRRTELFYLKLNPGLTEAQAVELAALDASFENEDRDSGRRWELFAKGFETRLTEAEKIEYNELQERYPPDPNDPLTKTNREMAELFGAIARSAPDDGGRNNEPKRAAAAVDECMKSESNAAALSGPLAPTPAERLELASPEVISDAELLKQLMSAANHNVVRGEAIEDVSPIRVMLQNGIELGDVLYTLRQQVDRRTYPKNRALASWSEPWFVLAVAEAYGWRVMLPVIKEKLEALGKRS